LLQKEWLWEIVIIGTFAIKVKDDCTESSAGCSLALARRSSESVLELPEHVNIPRTPMSQQMAGMSVNSASCSKRWNRSAYFFHVADELDGPVSQVARLRSIHPVDALL
jgi:hypothetical protein